MNDVSFRIFCFLLFKIRVLKKIISGVRSRVYKSCKIYVKNQKCGWSINVLLQGFIMKMWMFELSFEEKWIEGAEELLQIQDIY